MPEISRLKQAPAYDLDVYNLPGQERLLAYARHRHELERAERRIRLASNEPFEKDVREALIESAISLYISCFNSDISKLSSGKLFRNKRALKSLHDLIHSLRNKVIVHGDLIYNTAHLGVALDADSRIEYIDPFYVTVGEWLDARDIKKFFFLVRYVKKWVKKKLDEERELLAKKYKGSVPQENWYVGPIVTADSYNIISALRITGLHKLHKEAEIDETDTDIQVLKKPQVGKAEVRMPCAISIHRYDSVTPVNVKCAAGRQNVS